MSDEFSKVRGPSNTREPYTQAEMDALRRIAELGNEIERLRAELQYIYDNGIEIGGDECAEIARRALEDKT